MKRHVTLALALGLSGAAPVAGQVAWDTPFMVPPAAPRGLGIYLTDADPGGIGALVTYRRADAPAGLGLRVGVAEDRTDDVAVHGGVDFSGFLVRETPDVPLSVVWNLGLGMSAGDWVLLSFPLGVTIGKVIDTEEVTFNPYLGPRIVLDARLGDDAPRDDELDLDLAVDLGIDLSFDPRMAIRFAGTLGDDREGLAIGVVFPGAGR